MDINSRAYCKAYHVFRMLNFNQGNMTWFPKKRTWFPTKNEKTYFWETGSHDRKPGCYFSNPDHFFEKLGNLLEFLIPCFHKSKHIFFWKPSHIFGKPGHVFRKLDPFFGKLGHIFEGLAQKL